LEGAVREWYHPMKNSSEKIKYAKGVSFLIHYNMMNHNVLVMERYKYPPWMDNLGESPKTSWTE
jgi:hypothetical protein